jgi:VIT1/CCC1 family predicted Fe2+/Mn2+ transporter
MDENEANRSNYEELEGHCKVLSAKISQLTSGNSAVSSAVEDLEDYYERSLQMRIMANTTLREEIKELRAANEDFVARVVHGGILVLVGVAIGVAVWFPAESFAVFCATWTYAVVALGTAVVLNRWQRPDTQKNKRD